jgi:hypothetical protein
MHPDAFSILNQFSNFVPVPIITAKLRLIESQDELNFTLNDIIGDLTF